MTTEPQAGRQAVTGDIQRQSSGFGHCIPGCRSAGSKEMLFRKFWEWKKIHRSYYKYSKSFHLVCLFSEKWWQVALHFQDFGRLWSPLFVEYLGVLSSCDFNQISLDQHHDLLTRGHTLRGTPQQDSGAPLWGNSQICSASCLECSLTHLCLSASR